jgi:hypothetical protein
MITQMMGLGVGHSAAKEETMSMKASEVGEWFRKCAGKRDHHELMPEDYVVVWPGPKFHWFMGQGNSARTATLLPAPGQAPTRDDHRRSGAEDKAA